MKKFIDILKAIFATLIIILIIDLTGVVVIDSVFEIKTNQLNTTAQTNDSTYSTEMRDIGELFGITETDNDIPIETFDEKNAVTTPKLGSYAIFNEGGQNTLNSHYDNTAAVNEIYNKYYSILSSMQSLYQSRAEGIVASAKADYKAALDAGEDSETAKSNIYSKYISPLSALMSECDSAVESTLSQMSAELTSIGADTSTVNQLRTVYGSIVSGYSSQLQ